MKRCTFGIFLAIVLLFQCACGEKTPTWQEQYDLGMRYLEEGNYEEAILAFTAAIEIDPKQAPAYVGRGDAYVLSGDTRKNLKAAQADYEKAIDLDETLTDAYLGLADVYIQRGDNDKAREILQLGVDLASSTRKIKKKLEQTESDIGSPDQNIDDSLWRQAYLDHIQGNNWYGEALSDNTYHFKLVYVDSDDIPELWICNDVYATGSWVCTFDGEQVNELDISGYGDFDYIERSGLCHTIGGHMGSYWDGVYRLRNGQFEELGYGEFSDHYNAQLDEVEFQYYWNGTYVSEEEYTDSLARVFDMSAARNISDSPELSYNELYYILSN